MVLVEPRLSRSNATVRPGRPGFTPADLDGSPWPLFIAALAARLVLMTLAILLTAGALPMIFGWTPHAVLSGSMAPRIQPGDIVVSAPARVGDVQIGQVIAFRNPDHPDMTLVHRVASRTASGDVVTKGDANASQDSATIAAGVAVGLGRLRVPLVGLPALWWHQKNWLAMAAAATALLAASALIAWERRSRDRPTRGDGADTRLGFATGARVAPRHRYGLGARRASFIIAASIVAGTIPPGAAAFAASSESAANSWATAAVPPPTNASVALTCPVPPTVRSTTMLGAETTGMSLTISKPAGLQSGDVVVAFLQWNFTNLLSSEAVLPLPDGWQSISHADSALVDGKYSGALALSHVVTTPVAEPASYTWTFDNPNGQYLSYSAYAVAISGVDISAWPATAASAAQFQQAGVATSIDAPALSTYPAPSVELVFFGADSAAPWVPWAGTAPTTLTRVAAIDSQTGARQSALFSRSVPGQVGTLGPYPIEYHAHGAGDPKYASAALSLVLPGPPARATVSWTPPAQQTGVDGYELRRDPGGVVAHVSEAATTNDVDTSFAPGTSYTWSVATRWTSARGSWTSTAAATPAAGCGV